MAGGPFKEARGSKGSRGSTGSGIVGGSGSLVTLSAADGFGSRTA